MNNFEFLLPFVFVAIWALVLFIIAQFGYAALAKKYKTERPFIGASMGLISARVNFSNYNNALFLKCNEQGIYLNNVSLG